MYEDNNAGDDWRDFCDGMYIIDQDTIIAVGIYGSYRLKRLSYPAQLLKYIESTEPFFIGSVWDIDD